MVKPGKDALEVAGEFLARGWSPIPIPFRQKGPILEAWQNLRIEEADLPRYFRGRCNIGVLTGEPSGWLVDVDLDHPLAVELASEYLPATNCIFGRPGKLRSHFLYICPRVETHKRTTGKIAGMLVEVRSTGCQTVFPGSVHECGELIEWVEFGQPAVADPQELTAAVNALANEIERRLGIRDDLDDNAALPDVSGWVVENGEDSGLKPGSDFNARGDVPDVLRRAGWTSVRKEADRVERWRRPGKERGISGSLKDGKAFYCFTSSTSIPSSLESKRGYSPFAVYAYLEHDGDFSSAASALAKLRFGETAKSAAKPARRIQLPERFVPFPSTILPSPIGRFIGEAASAIGCDPTLVALPMLTTLAGCIGSSRRLLIKGGQSGWYAPSVLWTAAVVDSGQQKSPAQSAVTRLLYQRQGHDLKEHQERLIDYQKQLTNYECVLADWKRTKGPKGEPPERPEEPTCKRIIISDSTIEAVADRLQDNQRGLLLDRDELSGWLGSHDQYRSGRGSDVSHWLSCYNAKPLLIDRKTSTRKTIYVERAAVSITGGIQPRILARMLGKHHFENGLAARFAFGMPPKTNKQWSEASVSEDTSDALDWIYDWLLSLRFGQDHDGKPIPIDLSLSPDGKEAFVAFYNQHGLEQAELIGDLAALWAKLEEVAARIALVMHLVRCATDDSTLVSQNAVDAQSVAMGVTLARWFGIEGRRIYGVLAESDEDRDRRLLIELVQRKGGRITARDLSKSSRRYPTSDAAEHALIELVEAGAGRWKNNCTTDLGGRPTRAFCLVVGETPRERTENRGSGYADTYQDVTSEGTNPDAEEQAEWMG